MQRHYSSSTQPASARVVAVLGPTNTGKTYLALDRMLGHGSGMMGFPLRLLARENYDRAVAIKAMRYGRAASKADAMEWVDQALCNIPLK